uniref:Uncharacterized protein n=1 Tax=Panagrolaimus davidi TaxID=227884 RepID=A0A914QQS3_9BILA
MGDQPIRLSSGTVSVYPTTERKGRAKQLQIILKPSSLELHKSLKDWKNGKSPKHLIELGDLFNISLQVRNFTLDIKFVVMHTDYINLKC